MKRGDCEIINDLLPLYIDDACSEKSKEFIEEHIRQCSNCEKVFKQMSEEPNVPKIEFINEDKKALEIIEKINKRMVIKNILIAVTTSLVMGGLWIYFFIFETNNPYKNYLVTEISNLEDIMYYFKYAFFPYIVLFIVVIVNLVKVIYSYKKEKNFKGNVFSGMDLVIDILCGIAMSAGLLFQGVLADNNVVGYTLWCNALVIISIVSLIIFIVNLVLVFKSFLGNGNRKVNNKKIE